MNQGVGSNRYRLSYSGPGGHSFAAFGVANPIHALGRAIAMIDEMQVPVSPKRTFNVGRIGGGTSVNTISASAFAEIDMRSESMGELQKENEAVKQAALKALEDENHRWNDQGKLTMQLELLGFRPTGSTSDSSPLVRTIDAVNEALDYKPNRLRLASTDLNLPMSLGIPAITIGGGGIGTGPHTVMEGGGYPICWRERWGRTRRLRK